VPLTLCTFNANNLYVRYRFGATYPGDVSGKSAVVSLNSFINTLFPAGRPSVPWSQE
jgi:hypothetical protein